MATHSSSLGREASHVKGGTPKAQDRPRCAPELLITFPSSLLSLSERCFLQLPVAWEPIRPPLVVRGNANIQNLFPCEVFSTLSEKYELHVASSSWERHVYQRFPLKARVHRGPLVKLRSGAGGVKGRASPS